MKNATVQVQKLEVGAIVRTSYDTGPYVIEKIYGPHDDPPYLAIINHMGNEDDIPRSEPHYNMVLSLAGAVFPGSKHKASPSYLNGYRLDGTSVWTDDFLIFEGMAKGITGDLFSINEGDRDYE